MVNLNKKHTSEGQHKHRGKEDNNRKCVVLEKRPPPPPEGGHGAGVETGGDYLAVLRREPGAAILDGEVHLHELLGLVPYRDLGPFFFRCLRGLNGVGRRKPKYLSKNLVK